MTKTVFTDKPDDYGYFDLGNGLADVIIRQFDHEETDTEGNRVYIYNTNEFRVEKDVITEAMVAENPFKYLDYVVQKPASDSARLNALENAFLELSETLLN